MAYRHASFRFSRLLDALYALVAAVRPALSASIHNLFRLDGKSWTSAFATLKETAYRVVHGICANLNHYSRRLRTYVHHKIVSLASERLAHYLQWDSPDSCIIRQGTVTPPTTQAFLTATFGITHPPNLETTGTMTPEEKALRSLLYELAPAHLRDTDALREKIQRDQEEHALRFLQRVCDQPELTVDSQLGLLTDLVRDLFFSNVLERHQHVEELARFASDPGAMKAVYYEAELDNLRLFIEDLVDKIDDYLAHSNLVTLFSDTPRGRDASPDGPARAERIRQRLERLRGELLAIFAPYSDAPTQNTDRTLLADQFPIFNS